jgi:hypothetical protein
MQSMQNSIFLVNDEPYCLWELDIHTKNLEFLDGFDPHYFDYLLNLHINSDDEKRASVALSICLHHAIETLFSLIGAYIQAPDCAYAWIAKCQTGDLKKLIKRISESDNSIVTKLRIKPIAWESIATHVFSAYPAEKEKKQKTADLFANIWRRFHDEFTDETLSDQYNSMKHGFRVRSGGFTLAIGEETEHGIAPPESEMKSIGGSKYGATFFKVSRIGKNSKNRSIRSTRTSVNWSIQKTAGQIQLAGMSIQNIISSLRVINGTKSSEVKFVRPQQDSDFDMPWSHSTGVNYFSLDFSASEINTQETTREQLINVVSEIEQKEGS